MAATAAGTGETPTDRKRRTARQLKTGRLANTSTPTHQIPTIALNQGRTATSTVDCQEAIDAACCGDGRAATSELGLVFPTGSGSAAKSAGLLPSSSNR